MMRGVLYIATAPFWFVRFLWCSVMTGHELVFRRNIYGDEANVAPGRSVYVCVRCGGVCYGSLLHPEPKP